MFLKSSINESVSRNILLFELANIFAIYFAYSIFFKCKKAGFYFAASPRSLADYAYASALIIVDYFYWIAFITRYLALSAIYCATYFLSIALWYSGPKWRPIREI